MRTLLPVAMLFLLALNAPMGMAQDASSTTGGPAPAARVDPARHDFDLATSFYDRGDYAQAAELYANFRASYPDHELKSLALFREAECHFQTATRLPTAKAKPVYEKAQKLFATLQETDPQGQRTDETLLRLGQLAVALEDFEAAVLPLQRLLTRNVGEDLEAPGMFALARAYEGTQKYADAVKTYQLLRGKYPKSSLTPPALYLQAELEQERGKGKEALLLLDELITSPNLNLEADPSLVAKAYLAQGRILFQSGQYAKAAAAYGKVSSASPSVNQETRGLYGLAWCRFHVEDYPDARRTAENLLKRSLEEEVESGCQYLVGSSFYHEEKYAEAIEPLRRFLATSDNEELRKDAWYQLAWAYMLNGQGQEALTQSDELLRLGVPAGKASDLKYLAGRVHAEAKRWPLAAKAFLEARDTPGGQYRDDAAYAYAQACYNQGKYDETIEAFDVFINRHPKDTRIPDALRLSADASLKLSRFDEAANRLSQLIDSGAKPSDADQLLYQQAWAHNKLGEYDKMAEVLRRLLKEYPQSKYAAESQYGLAWIAEQNGDKEAAKEEYKTFLKNYPSHEWQPDVSRRLAVLMYTDGQEQEAYELLVELLASPEVKNLEPGICFWMALVAEQRGEYQRILQIMDALSKRSVDTGVAERIALTRGRTYINLQQWEDAERIANTALQDWPNSAFKADYLWVRGRAAWGQKKLDEAQADFEKGLTALGESGSTDNSFAVRLYFDSGEVLRASGKLLAAIRQYQKVAQLFDDPELSPQAFMRSAHCYEGLEEYGQIQKDLQDLIQRYPDHELSKEAREWLKRLEEAKKL